METLKGKQILITGGTGSLGQALVEYLFSGKDWPQTVTVFSRGENAQHAMSLRFPETKYPVRYRLGDIRDFERITEVSRGIDLIVHAAAMKHVPATEANPMECVKTNILGSQNVASAALRNEVPVVVALSTDKAAMPRGLYGASKLCLEKLFLTADLQGLARFSVVRFANVFGSKGSVIPVFMKLKGKGWLPITDPNMTRFSMTMQDAIDLVLFAVEKGWGGDTIIPKVPSYRLPDVATAVAPEAEQRVVGARPGENIHEWLISGADAGNTVRNGAYYVICPASGRYDVAEYMQKTAAEPVPQDFRYVSNENSQWLSVEAIRGLMDAENLGR